MYRCISACTYFIYRYIVLQRQDRTGYSAGIQKGEGVIYET